MSDEQDWARIARYIAGETTAAEAEELRRWIDADPARREALGFMRQMDTMVAGAPAWDTAAAWKHFTARKSARERRPALTPLATLERRRSPWRRRVLRVAAAALLVAGATVAYSALTTRHPLAPRHSARNVAEHATARGERAIFRLPDGSRVVLAAASRLRYPASFGDGRRELDLEGEAFFEVEHDASRPFVVRTRHGIAEDLGTKFSVQAYDADTAVRVIVAEGKVELRTARRRRGALLSAGQLGTLGATGEARVHTGIDLDRYLGWVQGRLVFDDTPLADALPELSRWYNIDFVLADPTLGARRLSATFAGEAIPETLELLASSLDVGYERRNQTVTFYPKRRTL